MICGRHLGVIELPLVKKRALISGISGQDGSYLAELLLEKGYEVHGVVRRSSSLKRERIDHLYLLDANNDRRHSIKLHYGDLIDSSSLARVIEHAQPDEIYNLGAQSHVKISFEIPQYTADVTAMGLLRLLDAVQLVGCKPKIYQAGSSEMFGKVVETPQSEKTPFYPRSPYGCAKVFAHWTAVNYREAYNLFISNGILFNHESPRRAENFVTRKITKGVADIVSKRSRVLKLGNLDAKRDWGFAGDYVEAMWLMLQQSEPDDFVIATGETHSVAEFCEKAFRHVGLDYREFVVTDPAFYRPTEVDLLLGNPEKAMAILGWKPKVKFDDLVKMMVEADLKAYA